MNDPDLRHDAAARRELWGHMRVPVFAFLALLVMLWMIVALGALMPGRTTSFLEVGLVVCMIGTVLLFSMEVREEAPLTRFFAVVGFAWVLILFGMTSLDYMSR